MGLYLGANALGGGGGGTPVGGVAYFSTPSTETFTEGQEVYTDPDGLVWIRTGAEITAQGTGTLDSDQYPLVNKVGQSLPFTTRYSTLANMRDNRWNITFSGKHVFIKGYNGSTNDVIIYDPDGTLVEGPIVAPATNISSAQMFFNDTHTFMASPSGGNYGGADVSNPEYHYLLTSTLTNHASYEATPIKTFPSPFSSYGTSAVVTNPGESNERHWFWHGGTVNLLKECTFDPTVASGTTPWTVTGNEITLDPVIGTYQTPKLAANGNILYVHENLSLHAYNATTRERISHTTLTKGYGSSDASYGPGMIVIPASVASSGVTEYIFSPLTTVGASIYSNNVMDVSNYANLVTGPNIAGDKILLTHQDKATTLDVDNVSISSGDNIYLWQRIA